MLQDCFYLRNHMVWFKECFSSFKDAICARKTEFSLSRNLALAAIVSSLCFRWSRDFLAAKLFLFRLSKYLLSFCSSGIGRFSPLGRLGVLFAKAWANNDEEDGTEMIKRLMCNRYHGCTIKNYVFRNRFNLLVSGSITCFWFWGIWCDGIINCSIFEDIFVVGALVSDNVFDDVGLSDNIWRACRNGDSMKLAIFFLKKVESRLVSLAINQTHNVKRW